MFFLNSSTSNVKINATISINENNTMGITIVSVFLKAMYIPNVKKKPRKIFRIKLG